jgi:hypothetical protein
MGVTDRKECVFLQRYQLGLASMGLGSLAKQASHLNRVLKTSFNYIRQYLKFLLILETMPLTDYERAIIIHFHLPESIRVVCAEKRLLLFVMGCVERLDMQLKMVLFKAFDNKIISYFLYSLLMSSHDVFFFICYAFSFKLRFLS